MSDGDAARDWIAFALGLGYQVAAFGPSAQEAERRARSRFCREWLSEPIIVTSRERSGGDLEGITRL